MPDIELAPFSIDKAIDKVCTTLPRGCGQTAKAPARMARSVEFVRNRRVAVFKISNCAIRNEPK